MRKLILAGDLNCPVDKTNGKAKIVLDYLLWEGLTLVNDGKVLTYICHNGGSAIDLTFVRGFSIVEQGLLTSNEAALIRKHIPVRMTLKAITPTRSPIKEQRMRSRLNLQLPQENVGRIPCLLHAINQRKLDEAMAGITEFIKDGITVTEHTRRAQKWFDKECYIERRITLRKLHAARRTKGRRDMEHYQAARRKFKALLKRKKRVFEAREDENLVKDYEKNPYKALRPRQPRFLADISIETWENHMRAMVTFKDTRPGLD